MLRSAEPPRNQILHCDCVDGMAGLPESCVPLTVTSPPYDRIFHFGGHPWDFDVFKTTADQLWRVTTPGGVVCWEVKDQYTEKGLSGTKYRQVLYFVDIGFRLHEEIFVKNTGIAHHAARHPEQVHMVFVLAKGKPRCLNRLEDRRNKTVGARQSLRRRYADGRRRNWQSEYGLVPVWGLRTHLWEIPYGTNQTTKDDLEGFYGSMSEQLAGDLIATYSRYGDVVLDPFSGSGTTAKMALLAHRDYLGFEIWDENHRLSQRRLALANVEYQKKLNQILRATRNGERECDLS